MSRIGYHPEPYWWNYLIGLFSPFHDLIRRHLRPHVED